jgi:hypothetical protein
MRGSGIGEVLDKVLVGSPEGLPANKTPAAPSGSPIKKTTTLAEVGRDETAGGRKEKEGRSVGRKRHAVL